MSKRTIEPNTTFYPVAVALITSGGTIPNVMVEREIELDSHTMFIGLVQAVHVDEAVLNANGEVDFTRAHGLTYESGVVRERPIYPFRVDDLRRAAQKGGDRSYK
jgi:hypothetical protein